jgi:hypothetical protein
MSKTSGFIQQCGPWIPCLKAGEENYTFTSEQLKKLLEKTYADGFNHAKNIYDTSWKTTVSTNCNSSNVWGK